jgi:hypothetical protein
MLTHPQLDNTKFGFVLTPAEHKKRNALSLRNKHLEKCDDTTQTGLKRSKSQTTGTTTFLDSFIAIPPRPAQIMLVSLNGLDHFFLSEFPSSNFLTPDYYALTFACELHQGLILVQFQMNLCHFFLFLFVQSAMDLLSRG